MGGFCFVSMEQVTTTHDAAKSVYEIIGKIIAGNEGDGALPDAPVSSATDDTKMPCPHQEDATIHPDANAGEGSTAAIKGELTRSANDLLKIDPERPVKPSELRRFAEEFHQLMMIYKSAARLIAGKIEILSEECTSCGRRRRIEGVKQRIKSPDSIASKLRAKGLPFTFTSMMQNVADIAGVRVICPYISDIYAVRESLLRQPDVHLVKQKDYIAHPKKSGYRSLHLVVETAVYLSETKHVVPVEIQLRTIAMDFWASLEHELRYKTASSVPRDIKKELCRCADTIARTDRQMEQIALRLRALD